MPKLKEVIDLFLNGFQYLDNETCHRHTRWYEFWYKIDALKTEYTDSELTREMELIALNCKTECAALSKTLGEEDFLDHKDAFFNIIFDTFFDIQVKRFVYGTISAEHYKFGEHYILERHLNPKKPGFIERSLIKGLEAIKNQCTELAEVLNTIIKTINQSELKPRLVFFEKATQDARGRMSYSETHCSEMNEKYYQQAVRNDYAQTHISRIG